MMNLKKIILINIIILISMYVILEIIFFNKFIDYWKKDDRNVAFFQTKLQDILDHYPPERFIKYNPDYKDKRPILMLGCSYVYGEQLPQEKNVTSKLTKLTNRWVYNMGAVGYGPTVSDVMLDIEEKKPLLEKSYPPPLASPEYVIYLYMFHHLQRWCYHQYYNYYRKNGLIPFQKYNFLYNSYIYRYFKDLEVDYYFNNDENFEKRLNLFYSLMHKMKLQSDKLFPDSKFIFLIYSDVNKDLCDGIKNSMNNDEKSINKLFEIMNSKEFRTRLEKEGITVVSTEELIGRKMNKPEDRAVNDPNHPHPSEKAWDEILVKLVKKFNL